MSRVPRRIRTDADLADHLTEQVEASRKASLHVALRRRAIEDAPSLTWHAVGDPGEPGFEGSFANYPGGVAVAFAIDQLGFVHLRGLAQSSAGDLTVFTLPAGFRPQTQYRARTEGVVGGVAVATAAIEIHTDGSVNAGPLSTWDSIYLDNHHFYVG
jgi:hypothetical protein